MKKLIVILVPIISVCAAVLLAVLFLIPAQTPAGRLMDVDAYVAQNITEISPQKAVLGGTFQVTEITAADGRGVVHYEDGHIALVADFTYSMSETDGIEILTFKVRK